MKFKLYEEFLNESLDKRLERATELAILFTLKQLLPDGGNNMYGDEIDWEKLDPIFPSIGPKDQPFQGGGPDLYINFDDADSGDFSKEFDILHDVMNTKYSNIPGKIEDKFLEYELQVESLSPGENIVHVAIPKSSGDKSVDGNRTVNGATTGYFNFIVNFYKTKEKKIKDLESKYKIALASNKYGL
jgi:hypothetical protein